MSDEKTATIAVCVPCGDLVTAGFTFDLTRLVGFMMASRPDIRVLLYMNKGTLLPEQRHDLVREALRAEPTHLLWIDSDMRFPKDVLARMLAWAQPIIACNYATRRQPVIPTASTGAGDALLFSEDGEPDLVEVTRCGMGLMLVEAGVYRQTPTPWFAVGFNREQDGYAGEDVFFCDVARKAGFRTMVDPALSREVRHCGEFEYGLVHADVTKAKYLEQQREARQQAAQET